MLVGIDSGSTLVKAAWGEPGRLQTRRVSRDQLPALLAELRDLGARRLGLAGTRYRDPAFAELGLERVEVTGEDIDREVELQTRGLRSLLAAEGEDPAALLIVSVGTGVSYALSEAGLPARRFPLGSALGGGFLAGLGAALGLADVQELAAEASRGEVVDLCVADLLPGQAKSALGRMVVAHFGRAGAETPRPDLCATLFSTVSTGIARDLLLIRGSAGWSLPDDVAFVGSTLDLAPLRAGLLGWARTLGLRALVPPLGAYALAWGARLALADA